jgi:hypothetical protein
MSLADYDDISSYLLRMIKYEVILLLLKKHPIVSLCVGCLALYGVSMLLFMQRDENSGNRKTWVEESESPRPRSKKAAK